MQAASEQGMPLRWIQSYDKRLHNHKQSAVAVVIYRSFSDRELVIRLTQQRYLLREHACII